VHCSCAYNLFARHHFKNKNNTHHKGT
jgi:hypothetical protein